MMQVELATCAIRDWRPGDEPSLVRHANNRMVWLGLRDSFPHPYTIADARHWIRLASGERRQTAFAIAVDDFVVGAVGLKPGEDINRMSAEIGYWLGEEFWGRGIMTDSVRALTAYAFTNLGLNRVFAEVFEGNQASMRVLEKAGYEREGRLVASAIKDGQLLSQVVYANVLDHPSRDGVDL